MRVPRAMRRATAVQVQLCVPNDQEAHVPKRRRAPQFLPPNAPLPRIGEVIHLSSTSAWRVSLVLHEWHTPKDLHVQVWLDWIGPAHMQRPAEFAMTQ